MSQVHIRYEGQSLDLEQADLDVGDLSTDADITEAVALHLQQPATKFAAFTIDRNAETGDITMRPQAVFG